MGQKVSYGRIGVGIVCGTSIGLHGDIDVRLYTMIVVGLYYGVNADK